MIGTIMSEINIRDFENLVWHKKYSEMVEMLDAHPEVKKRFVQHYYGKEVSTRKMAEIMCTMYYKDLRVILDPNYYGWSDGLPCG